ncbi:MAG: ECF transporter S component [Lentilactobacillus hilgardii]|uniref:ECF transporter S component n=1 Tax=Lentilactobacillus hilgardii TaxID=1588 RepID=UPI001CC1E8BE|nr:ECF transporter S component [Lentilactobacillus hilgardii]MBZ2202154.1 ECF transporter S component [Lentilactobacillus hilgardii]MBZ2205138.1 ECF transporter S component [Lentilactobacillus hilgardii]
MDHQKSVGSKSITNNLFKIVLTAMFIAITVAISRFLIIPVPMTHGYINLCDAGIFISAILIGPLAGGIVGGASGFILDLTAGYSQYMWFSLIVHGIEGLIVGLICHRDNNLKWAKIIAVIIGIIIMVTGYFVADSILYTAFAGFIGIGSNIIQGVAGAIIACIVTPKLKRRF